MHSTYEELPCIYTWLHLLREALGLQARRLVGPTRTTEISSLNFWLKEPWWFSWRRGDSSSFCWSDQCHGKEVEGNSWVLPHLLPLEAAPAKPFPLKHSTQRIWEDLISKEILGERNENQRKVKPKISKIQNWQVLQAQTQ